MKPFSPIFKRFYQVLSLIMALHLFNSSTDSRDKDPDSFPEDLTFNDIESITEFIAEVVLDWQDAFSEHDEPDHENGGSVDYYKYYFTNNSPLAAEAPARIVCVLKFHLRNPNDFVSLSQEIVSPPPKG